MRIHKAVIGNYKSIHYPLELELCSGITLFVGVNNSGKSAILESIALQYRYIPHRNTTTKKYSYTVLDEESWVDLTLTASLVNLFATRDSGFSMNTSRNSNGPEFNKTVEFVIEGKEIFVYSSSSTEHSSSQPPYLEDHISLYGAFKGMKSSDVSSNPPMFFRNIDGSIEQKNSHFFFDFPVSTCMQVMSRIYFCSSKRNVKGQTSVGDNRSLSTDFSNLPEVLSRLQSNIGLFEEFNRMISAVLPFIKRISVQTINDTILGMSFKVQVWSAHTPTDREDLTIPLNDAGSGVGQVLGILYLLITSSDPRVIVIDEISNFLYPAAARKLLEVFAQYPQHQYLVSTHSADLLGHRAVERIYHVQLHEGQTQVDLLDKNDVDAMRLLMLEIGASISELYGAERILWVEGPTEERGFRDILKAFYDMSLVDCVLVGVHHTGDFEQKKGGQKRLIFNVYRKLSEAHSLLPKSIGFVFDHEGRSETEISDLERESGGTAYVLERRLYENYLLDPEAIVALLEHERPKSLEDGSDWTTPVTVEQVETWLTAHRSDKAYQASALTSSSFLSDTDWIRDVHGANLLHDLFNELSDSKLNYKANKVTFSVWLTGWLLEHKRENLADLAQFLKNVLEQKQD